MKTYQSLLICLVLALLLSGCSRSMDDLNRYIAQVKSRKAGAIEKIPQVKPYEKYTYQSSLIRSPFVPDIEAEQEQTRQRNVDGPQRDTNRNKEFLEQFPLDSLQMVGTLNSRGVDYALIKTADGLIHQVRAGNYMGENDGRVMKVTDAGIEIREIVPDGLGGYVYRPSELPLEENI